MKHVLQDAYQGAQREIASMPLACKRSQVNKSYVEWTSSATILGDLAEPGCANALFEIRPNTQLVRLNRDDTSDKGNILFATARNLMNNKQ